MHNWDTILCGEWKITVGHCWFIRWKIQKAIFKELKNCNAIVYGLWALWPESKPLEVRQNSDRLDMEKKRGAAGKSQDRICKGKKLKKKVLKCHLEKSFFLRWCGIERKSLLKAEFNWPDHILYPTYLITNALTYVLDNEFEMFVRK